MKKEYVAASIGAIATIAAAIIGSSIGKTSGSQETLNEIQTAFANITGDNATVTINDIGNFANNYEDIKTENEGLKTLNSQYSTQLTSNASELEELKNQLGDTPVLSFNNLSLSINGEDKSN